MPRSRFLNHMLLLYHFCKAGLSFETVARKAGVNKATLSKIINGHVKSLGDVGFDTIYGITKALGITIDDLIEVKKPITFIGLFRHMFVNGIQKRVNYYELWARVCLSNKYNAPVFEDKKSKLMQLDVFDEKGEWYMDENMTLKKRGSSPRLERKHNVYKDRGIRRK